MAQDLRSLMRFAASSSRRVRGNAHLLRCDIGAVNCGVSPSSSERAKSRKSRYSIDFDVETLKSLKHFAVDLEVDASDILKYLVARIAEDGDWRREVEAHFTPPG